MIQHAAYELIMFLGTPPMSLILLMLSSVGLVIALVGGREIRDQIRDQTNTINQKNRCLHELEMELERVSAPALYNDDYCPGDDGGKKVPLGYMGFEWYQGLAPLHISHRLDFARALVMSPNHVNELCVVFETSLGVFVRTLEAEAQNVEVNDKEVHVSVEWAPIHAGQSLVIHRACIQFRDKVLSECPEMGAMSVSPGDTINMTYQFHTP